VKEEGGRYLVFEVKVANPPPLARPGTWRRGSSPLGDRKITDVPGVRTEAIVEQGTRPYLLQILFEMKKKPSSKKIAEKLEEALDSGELDYLYFRQDFDKLGNLKPPEIGQFDIRE
jgi:hypothetical protein